MERFKSYITATRAALFFSLVGMAFIVYGLINPQSEAIKVPSKSLINPSSSPEMSVIKAYITGAVKQPGVYILTSEDRVADLVIKAGGFTENANQEYISKDINLAQKVSDGFKIYIPDLNESYQNKSFLTSPSGVDATNNNLISLNAATASQLDQLPGVGSVTATKIINARPFASLEDLLTKQVVNKSVYDKIKDLITLN